MPPSTNNRAEWLDRWPFSGTRRWKAALALAVLGLMTWAPAVAGDDTTIDIGVLVSLRIKPYMDAVNGMETVLKDRDRVHWDVFFLDANRDQSDHAMVEEKLTGKAYDVLLAVGPEAMNLIWTAFPDDRPVKLFSMVMKPRRVVPQAGPLCGVPLDLPPRAHLVEFQRFAPFLRRVGLIYDPKNNADFASQATDAAMERGVDLVHLRVRSRQELLPAFRSRRNQIDALWMIPDATVISESIIPFLIKEAIANDVAVFGYNRFFNENGAALSLIRDYEAIGRHVALQALAAVVAHPCRMETPDYKVLINQDVLRAIGYGGDMEYNRSPDPVP